VSFLEELKEVTDNATVATVEESSRYASVPGTASSANAVNVVVDVGRKVVIDNMSDVGYVQTFPDG
jgi:hypothetical protein